MDSDGAAVGSAHLIVRQYVQELIDVQRYRRIFSDRLLYAQVQITLERHRPPLKKPRVIVKNQGLEDRVLFRSGGIRMQYSVGGSDIGFRTTVLLQGLRGGEERHLERGADRQTDLGYMYVCYEVAVQTLTDISLRPVVQTDIMILYVDAVHYSRTLLGGVHPFTVAIYRP